MSTAQDIVIEGLKLSGQHSIINPAGPELINQGFSVLVSLLSQWKSDGICFCSTFVYPDELSDELNEPPLVKLGLQSNLAVAMAPYNNRDLPGRVYAASKRDYNAIFAKYGNSEEVEYPDILAVGAGNIWWPRGRTFYPIPDDDEECSSNLCTTLCTPSYWSGELDASNTPFTQDPFDSIEENVGISGTGGTAYGYISGEWAYSDDIAIEFSWIDDAGGTTYINWFSDFGSLGLQLTISPSGSCQVAVTPPALAPIKIIIGTISFPALSGGETFVASIESVAGFAQARVMVDGTIYKLASGPWQVSLYENPDTKKRFRWGSQSRSNTDRTVCATVKGQYQLTYTDGAKDLCGDLLAS